MNTFRFTPYNWCAATNRINATENEKLSETGLQGICPDGWHVPTILEVEALIQEINQFTSKYSSLADIKTNNIKNVNVGLANAVLSSNQPLIGSVVYNGKSNDSNNNGFNMFALGYGLSGIINSASGAQTMYANIWTSSNNNTTTAYYCFAVKTNSEEFVSLTSWNKRALFPIRCKKD